MGTWKLVDKPPDVVPIGNKFVFAKKSDKDGILIKHKAQLIAKGCVQQPGFNYFKMHTPIVRLETIHVMIDLKISFSLAPQEVPL